MAARDWKHVAKENILFFSNQGEGGGPGGQEHISIFGKVGGFYQNKRIKLKKASQTHILQVRLTQISCQFHFVSSITIQ